jgi:hypothetical protein
MATETLFGTEVPAITNASDGAVYVLGTRFTPAVNGTVTHGRWYFPTTAQNGVIHGVYRTSDQVLLGQQSFPDATPSGWQQVAYGTPVSLVAGVEYLYALRLPSNYVATVGYPWPKVSTGGNLTAGTDNGWLINASAALQFPTTKSGNGASFFVDGVFSTGASTTPWSKDLDLRWRVLAGWAQDVDVRWRVLAAWQKDFDARWRVLNSWSKDVDVRWRLLGQWSADVVLAWRTLNAWQKDVDLLWQVLNSTPWTKDVELRWRTLNNWSADVDLRWRTLNAWVRDVDLVWRVLGTWNKDLVVLWQVLAGTPWATDLQLVWRTRGQWQKDVTVLWRVLSEVPPTPLPADVRAVLEDYVQGNLTSDHVVERLQGL